MTNWCYWVINEDDFIAFSLLERARSALNPPSTFSQLKRSNVFLSATIASHKKQTSVIFFFAITLQSHCVSPDLPVDYSNIGATAPLIQTPGHFELGRLKQQTNKQMNK